jgi:hypothetical protein
MMLKRMLKDSICNRVRKGIKIIDFIISILIIVNVTLAIYENNLRLDDISNKAVDLIRWIIICNVIGIILFLIMRCYLYIRLMRLYTKACKNDNLVTSGLWKKFIFDILLLGIFSPPHTDSVITGYMLFGRYSYSSHSIILVRIILKLFYFEWLFQYGNLNKITIIGRHYKVSVGHSFYFQSST